MLSVIVIRMDWLDLEMIIRWY